MADNASQWLTQHELRGQTARLLIVAGAGHCHNTAIPMRVTRRTHLPVLSVRPLAQSELGKHTAPRDDEFDLLLVTTAPGED
jgi:phosphoribosylcarboxyaminoimidazole (NCAIR) mutase